VFTYRLSPTPRNLYWREQANALIELGPEARISPQIRYSDCSGSSESRRTVLYSHLCCTGRFFTACGVASKVSNLSEWHNRMVMPVASRKPSYG
jgi:hypothetical protein